MKLLTKDIYERLAKNGRIRDRCNKAEMTEPDFLPVVKLFTPDAQCTWLLIELDPEDLDIAFGLCDLGMGCPELGYLSISEGFQNALRIQNQHHPEIAQVIGNSPGVQEGYKLVDGAKCVESYARLGSRVVVGIPGGGADGGIVQALEPGPDQAGDYLCPSAPFPHRATFGEQVGDHPGVFSGDHHL